MTIARRGLLRGVRVVKMSRIVRQAREQVTTRTRTLPREYVFMSFL
jgi:hypothetical protein